MNFWTKANVARLTSMWADGYPASSMASALGTTRNAIIGKANRIGLPPRKEPVNPLAAKRGAVPAVNADRARRAAKKSRAVAAPPLVPVDPPVAVLAPAPSGRTPVTFLAAGDFVCKLFLPGQPIASHGLVCGNPVEVGSQTRFCPACKVALGITVLSPPSLNDKTLFMFPRKRQQARAA